MGTFEKDRNILAGRGESDFRESEHPRDENGMFTTKGVSTYPQNTKYEDILKSDKREGLTSDKKSDYSLAFENEPYITKEIVNTANFCGLQLLGLKNRLKTEESYNRKAKKAGGKEIRDVIRYTALSDESKYTQDISRFIDILKEKGYNTIVVKNTWKNGATYKGINTYIKAPSGQVFEMQYHTKASFELKNGKLHELYEKQRVLAVDSSRAEKLKEEMVDLSKKLIHPNRIEEIKSYGN